MDIAMTGEINSENGLLSQLEDTLILNTKPPPPIHRALTPPYAHMCFSSCLQDAKCTAGQETGGMQSTTAYLEVTTI